MFTWERGRRLGSWHIIYIDTGEGRFEAQPGGAHAIGPGDVFILFPEALHR